MPADDAPEELLDYYLRRRIFQGRWSAAEARAIILLLRATNTSILALLATNIDTDRREQLDSLLAQSDALQDRLALELVQATEPRLRELVQAELDSQIALLERLEIRIGDVLNPAAVFAAATEDPIRGRYLSEWFSTLTAVEQQRIVDILRIGYVEGQTAGEMIRQIQQIMENSERDAAAIIRTATTHYASAAQLEIMRASPDLVDRYRWTSTLDTRTTPICRARDGMEYRIGGPVPPAHVACRSIIVPMIRGMASPSQPTYNDWIKRQPPEVQDDILGPSRAELLRAGVSVARFVDGTGRTYTLAELEQRERSAWQRAGL